MYGYALQTQYIIYKHFRHTSFVGKLCHELSKVHFLPPDCSLWLILNLLDIGRVDTCLEVGTAGSQQDIVGVPVKTEYRGTQRLLDVLAHPPVAGQIQHYYASNVHA